MELRATTAEAYLRHAFTQLLAAADRLGDPAVNARPLGAGTNSVASLVVHCCGVTEYWLGHVALGVSSSRDREGEFTASASSTELHELVAATIGRACDHLRRIDAGEGTDEGGRQLLYGADSSDGSVVLHVLEDLYQHLGHAEVTVDALTRWPVDGADAPEPATPPHP